MDYSRCDIQGRRPPTNTEQAKRNGTITNTGPRGESLSVYVISFKTIVFCDFCRNKKTLSGWCTRFLDSDLPLTLDIHKTKSKKSY